MKILLTGAAGFIGHHLALMLMDEGHDCVGVDSLNDYYDVQLKLDRLKIQGVRGAASGFVSKHKNYEFFKLDLSKRESLNILKDKNFDLIIHLAAQAGVRYSITNPEKYVDSNIIGFFNVLEFARNNNIGRVIYASSSSVYGNLNKVPFNEDLNVDKPISFYAATKKSNELMAHVYSHLFNIQTIGLRFFTVYGPWGRPDMAAFIFTKSILEGIPIKLYNYGNNKRDFTYVSDIVNSINLIIKNINKLPKFEIYNSGYGKPFSTIEFVKILEKYIQKEAILELTDSVPGDVEVTFADTSKLRSATGFQPQVELEDGLGIFVDWYFSYFGYDLSNK